MTNHADIACGDQRLAPFRGRHGWQFGVLGAFFTCAFFAGYIYGALSEAQALGTPAVAIDFRVFWAAGQIALSGTPLDVFDPQIMGQAHATQAEKWMPWLYPPGYLIFVTPFGALPFGVAWVGFCLASLALVAWALRPFTAGIAPLWLGMALAPGFLPALFTGQNSLLWLAAMLAALSALRAQRWGLAGLVIGLMTLKPQLGLLIPVALLAMGAWRTIATAALTTLVITIGPTLLYGLGYWSALREMVALHGARVFAQVDSLPAMVSPFSLLTSFGLAPSLALNLQWTLTLALVAIVFLGWRNPRISFDLKAAVLLIATALATPYFWHYENALLAAAALFLMRAGLLDTRRIGLALFGLLWIGPGLSIVLNTLSPAGQPISTRYLITPVVLIAMALCTRAVLWHDRTAPESPHPGPSQT